LEKEKRSREEEKNKA